MKGLRMWWLLLVVLALNSPAWATVTWTCTRDFTLHPTSSFYETIGSCIASGTYTGSGGDAVGATNSVKDTGAAICGSASSVVLKMVTTNLAAASAPTALVVSQYDATNRKMQCFTANGNVATTPLQECGNGLTLTGVVFQYIAYCR